MTRRAAVILAAGQGTRMKSPTPKVLHKVGGRTLLDRAIDAAQELGCERIVVVVGAHSPQVGEHAARRLGAEAIAVQDPPLGTGHAVLAAREALAGFDGQVVITAGDTPLMDAAAIAPVLEAGADVAVLGFEARDPHGYGRLVIENGRLLAIVEEKEADAAQKGIRACNSGVIAAEARLLFDLLGRVTNQNAKGEYYLTDIIGLANEAGRTVAAAFSPEEATMGVNSQAQLAEAEAIWQRTARTRLMEEGVSMQAPETVFLSSDTVIGAGAVVEANVVFGPGVTVEGGATIRAFSHLEGCVVRAGAIIGPYARLRPGADIGEDAHIGNFVEVKKVKVGKGAKANHLSYLGDGTVGPKANIGAGTIFCNYDGFEKFETHVGEGAFIGSDSALVAPVRIGKGAMTGSGSVITRDVPDDALALARGQQVDKPGWAAAFREKKLAARKKP
jgi:bifunctional UDP-N-acetylglucosamine pyrophosphorylase/glucosamine-1-phosphate N-acetyltransferase